MALVNLDNFCNTLDKFYNHLSSPQYISNKEEKEYLYNAYMNIEKLWYENFEQIKNLSLPNLVPERITIDSSKLSSQVCSGTHCSVCSNDLPGVQHSSFEQRAKRDCLC